MTLPPQRYAEMLGRKMREHHAGAWLVNTGWVGGPYGVGQRISLSYSRTLVEAILSGELRDAPFAEHPIFGFEYPTSCPNVPDTLLDARRMWPDPSAYDARARELARRFHENFERFGTVDRSIREAGPRL
jgi:phosphoenolpyruvate carboxykinase (ATP)